MRPIIQMTNLTNMFGVAIGPQVAEPFVGHYDHIPPNATVTVTPPNAHEGFQPVQKAYVIVAAMDVGMAIICLIMCAWSSISTGHCKMFAREADDDDDVQLIPDDSDASKNDNHQQLKVKPCSVLGGALLTLVFLLFFLNAGRDVLLTGLLFTYLYEYLEWSVHGGTLLSTVFHLVCFAFAIVVVPATRWVSPTQLVIVDLVTLLISSMMMTIALVVVYHGAFFTTLGIILAGVGSSNIHPTIITLVDETIPVTAPVMALFISAFGVSLVVIGPVSGISLHANVISFPLMLLAQTLAGILLFVVYVVILRWMKSSEPVTSLEIREPGRQNGSLGDGS